jgi:hypothetical protein
MILWGKYYALRLSLVYRGADPIYHYPVTDYWPCLTAPLTSGEIDIRRVT